jgi:hypothetical protein
MRHVTRIKAEYDFFFLDVQEIKADVINKNYTSRRKGLSLRNAHCCPQ